MEEKKDNQYGMEKRRFRTYVILIAFGITLLVALLNLNVLFKYFGLFLELITPILIGLGFAFILNIPMTVIEHNLLGFIDKVPSFKKKKKKLNRDKLKRFTAIILTIIIILGAIAGIFTFLIPQLINSVNTLIEKFPDYYASFKEWIDQLFLIFKLPGNVWEQLSTQWDEIFKGIGNYLMDLAPDIYDATVSLTTGIFNFFLGLILSIYMLADKEKLLTIKDKLLCAYVPKEKVEFIEDVSKTANDVFHGFIAGQITEAIIIGTLCGLGLAILQVPYALLIGVLVGSTSVIPVFGAFLGAIPSGFILLIVDPLYALIFVIYILVLQQVEGNFIYPKVVGSSIGLSGIWVLIGMLIGANLFGFLGIVLGIPTLAVFYSVFKKITNKRIQKKECSQTSRV